MLFEKESHRVDKLRKLSDKIVSTVSERTILLKGLKEQVKLFSQFDFNYQFIYLLYNYTGYGMAGWVSKCKN